MFDPFVVLLYLFICIGLAYIATVKGRSGVKLFFLSLLTSPVIGVVVLVLLKSTQVCPFCATKIPQTAVFCPNCQKEIGHERETAA